MDRKSFLKKAGLLSMIPFSNNLQALGQIASSFAPSPKMPVLFLGHGSPMNAIEENEFVQGFRKVAATLPHPSAILCISAHWFTHGTKVTVMDMPRTIHDFGGFPRALFEVQYPAKGSPELARETQKLLQPVAVELDDKWGLDHGAWSVLTHLYPKADIPVIQMSIDYTKGPEYHYELARQLQSLRSRGILIVGSGNIVHNLGLVDFRNINKDNYGFDWAVESRDKINKWLLDGNFDPIVQYEKQGRAIQLAVPTPDHYLPLVYALGLKGEKESLSLFNDKMVGGSLSMTSVKIS
ncbi:MAG: 4,5-DOPA dioxygenase extradiol [Chitinophagaceae bacterium]